MNARELMAVVPMVLGAPAMALHEGDVVVRLNAENSLEIGGQVEDGLEFPIFVTLAEFGNDGFANFTDDPGFDSPAFTFPTDETIEIGFTIVGSLKEWDGDFEQTSVERLIVAKFGDEFLVPLDESEVVGRVFGASDGAGVFHHHISFYFENFAGPALEGVWLLVLRLWSPNEGVGDSQDLYMVFAQGSGVSDQAAAAAWVEANLLDPGCPADLDPPGGDGALGFFDLVAYLTLFAATDPAADLDPPGGDGAFGFFDLVAYLTLFAAGCP